MSSNDPADITETLKQILRNQQSYQNDLNSLSAEMSNIRTRFPPPGFTSAYANTSNPHAFSTAAIKLDIPRFNGTDPLGWIFKINQFFDFHQTVEDQRLRIASFYMEGDALSWYQWMYSIGQLLSWATFLHALELRFAPSKYEDPQGALFKLCQTSTVRAYQAEFESLANRIMGLPPQFYLSCFVSGMKPEIRREVQSFQPLSLHHAISLAKLQEEKFLDRFTLSPKKLEPQNFNRPITKPTITTTPTPTKPLQKPSPPIKRLSPAELQARRDKNLCYNCDETFHPGHRCRCQFMILVAEPDDKNDNSEETLTQLLITNNPHNQTDPQPTTTNDPTQISLHALMGHSIPQTLRVLGRIKNHPVSVLIDSGSTHNFVEDRIAKQLGLPLESNNSFQVLVGNGEQLPCSSFCPKLPLQLDSHNFLVDLFVLPLSGAELVLGVQWLKTLRPILTDYEALTMKFVKEGQVVQLFGQHKPSPLESSLHQLRRLADTNAIDTCLSLQLLSPSPTQPHHSPPLPADITTLMVKYNKLFAEPHKLPPRRQTDHQIPLNHNTDPVNVRPYRYPQFQKKEIESQIREMLQQGIIQLSNSAFSSPVLLVRKKDGSWRFCVDYRALNAITIKDRFPIPTIEELFDELYGTQWFSKLDLRSGYHQIRMNEADIHKTAFRTHLGHYEFLVMPFGLCNAPSSFQSTMNELFQPYLRKFVIVFFDDILVYSRTWEEHLQHLEIVFQCLIKHQFFLKKSKCSIAQPSISYLGHIVSASGVGPDPEKIVAMVDWPTPSSVKQLRGFLGLTGFYRKFIHNYAMIAAPLTALLKKDGFLWNEQAQQAFVQLKDAMTKTPVLALPNFDEDFVMENDASGLGMGAVLSQRGHPICFYSKKFCPKLLNSLTYVRELCTITSAVKKWRAYLLGRKFTIHTDQRSLRELMTQIVQTPEQHFYLAKLLGYSYQIVYKPGAQNKVADALSRIHNITTQQSFLEDEQLQQLLQQIQQEPQKHEGFKIINGMLFYRNKLYIPSSSPLKQSLLEEFHSSLFGGHSGIHKTWGIIKENVYWEGMKSDVIQFINSCEVCQQTKIPAQLPYGLLQPLSIPVGVWEDISMDFIAFQRFTVIFVVVDRFSKAAHFGMLPTQFTVVQVAELFTKMICKLHGMPKSIVSDRDPIFLSKFWQQLFRLSGTKLRMSTAYHPQSDGQTEVVNKALQQYLRCFVHNKPSKWGQYLHWAEWHYNTSVHTTTGFSPFQVVYGKPPPSLPQYIAGSS